MPSNTIASLVAELLADRRVASALTARTRRASASPATPLIAASRLDADWLASAVAQRLRTSSVLPTAIAASPASASVFDASRLASAVAQRLRVASPAAASAASASADRIASALARRLGVSVASPAAAASASADLVASALVRRLGVSAASPAAASANADLVASALARQLGFASPAVAASATADRLASALAGSFRGVGASAVASALNALLGGRGDKVKPSSPIVTPTGPLRNVADADRLAERLVATLGEGTQSDADAAALASALRRFVRPETGTDDLTIREVQADDKEEYQG